MSELRKCNFCKEFKEADKDFYPHNTIHKTRRICKDCERSSRRARKYNLSLEDVNSIIDNHSGCCEICDNELLTPDIKIDHCHKSGIVRGLLCNNCNSGLGFFREDKEIMVKAMKYLDKYNTCDTPMDQSDSDKEVVGGSNPPRRT